MIKDKYVAAVTEQDEIDFQSDVLVDMGWRFFERNGRHYCRAKVGSKEVDCPDGHDTQAGAVRCGFAFATEIGSKFAPFGVALMLTCEKHVRKFVAEVDARERVPETKPDWMVKMMGGSPG